MKPFITEEQLALYKYQRSSKYYGMPMSDILNSEFADFLAAKHFKSHVRELPKFFEYFMHRKINDDKWEIWCSDLSRFYLCFEKSDWSGSATGECCRFYSVPSLPDDE